MDTYFIHMEKGKNTSYIYIKSNRHLTPLRVGLGHNYPSREKIRN